MAHDQVDKVRRSIDAYNRGDYEAAVKDYHPDVTWEFSADAGSAVGGSHHGREGVRRFWTDLEEHFGSFRLEPSEFRAAPNAVMCRVRLVGRGRGSGANVEMSVYLVARFEDGLIVRATYLFSEAEALEALELRE